MPASSLAISMFHKRLALLLVLMAGGVVVLTAQLGRLTLAHGAEHRAAAESKLVMLDWMGTSRGRILDRTGRVLAKDRPSFDVTVDYRVLSGEWATIKAAAVAKKLNRQVWGKMSQEERKASIDEYRGVFEAHIDAMWRTFAATAGISAADVGIRRDRITSEVQKKYDYLKNARIVKGIDAKLAEGQLISEDVEDQIRLEASAVINEQQSPHVVLPKVDDAVGFAFKKLMGQEVEIVIPISSGEMRQKVPLMPGLVVTDAGDREYPYEAMKVEVDMSSLPGSLKKPGKQSILMEGVGYHILGRMENDAYIDRRVQRRGKEELVEGHETERNNRLKKDAKTGVRADEAFAARVLARDDLHIPESLRDLGRYRFNDDAGFGGIEESCEDTLRGLRGVTVAQLDTGKKEPIAPVPGQDVRLTIDVSLQARVQAAMSPEFGLAVAQPWHSHENPTVPPGTVLNGAAVVLDVESGDILALVTTPSVSRRELRTDPKKLFEDDLNKAVNMPWLDRAIARPYPPGSIVKALILNGASKLGSHALEAPIECNGHLFPDKPNEFRCWIYKGEKHTTHTALLEHALSGAEGLMVSCNIYFFTLGQRLGPEGIVDTYTRFGVGQPWNLGVGMEFAGELGVKDKNGKRLAISQQDAIQMGIGQGPVSWTPLHAADAYATLARGGKRIRPHLVKDGSTPAVEDLQLDQAAVKEAMEGLSMSVNDDTWGTGNHVDIPRPEGQQSDRVYNFKNLPNVKVWGKTGTAQAPTIFTRGERVDPETNAKVAADALYDKSVEAGPIREAARDPKIEFKPGYRALRWGDHSWFVVLVGHQDDQRPLFAIAVMMEYAGSGGKVSGPIVTQIIRALMTEGYL